MEKNENILIVHNYYQIPGGEDTVVANEKKLLEDNGHKVILYSRNNTEIKKFNIFKKLLLPFTTIFSFKTYREVKNIIKNEKIDIVHVHNTLSLISPSVYYAAFFCKIPVVQTVHNFRFLCPNGTFYRDNKICEDCINKGLRCALKYKCYRNSFLQTLAVVLMTTFHRIIGTYSKINYICLTEFNKNKLLSLKQIKENQVFVKPNFITDNHSIISYKKRKNQYVFAGRLDKLKGIDILLKAWRLLGSNAPKLIVCGTGDMNNWAKEFVRENKLSNVILKGFVPNDEVKKIIAKSKAVILPTQWYEGFPMNIVEAYSTGTPVLGSNIGNVADIIGEFKFNSNSSEDIIRVIHEFEQSDMQEISNKIYKRFENEFSSGVNYSHLEYIYKKSIRGV